MDSAKRIVLFPIPFQGHINPMIQLASILHSKGFQISIIHTQFNFPDPSKHPHFTFHRISDGLPDSQRSTTDVIIRLVRLLNTNCIDALRRCLAQLSSSHGRPCCLITDAVWYSTQAVADEFNLPRIVIRTSSACSFLSFCFFPILRQKGYLTNTDSKMEDDIVELPPLRVKDIPTIEGANQDELFHFITTTVEATKKASALIFNTFTELEQPELDKLQLQLQIPIFPIGPFHKCFSAASTSLTPQDRSCISWLDKQVPKSVLYVSFGSIAELDEKMLLEVGWGLANSKQPFLWVIRPGLVRNSEFQLPDELLNAVRGISYILKWAPQQEILSHPAIGGFWTHGGWNSTLESICEGVPMICLPFFGDQMVNSRYVDDVWRIGIKLEEGEVERGEVENAVRKLMVEREGEEMRERVERMKEKADLCFKATAGSSYRALDEFIRLILSSASTA